MTRRKTSGGRLFCADRSGTKTANEKCEAFRVCLYVVRNPDMPGENGKEENMGFQKFVDNIVDLLQERMGDSYEIRVLHVTKNNDVEQTGIAITRQEDSIFPTIYLESLYQEYREGERLGVLVQRIINCHEEQSMALDLDMDFFRDYSRVKDRIFYKLVSFEKNKRFLRDAPHLRWHDLAIVFYYALEEDMVEGGSITIKRPHMLMWKQNAESLYRTAGAFGFHAGTDCGDDGRQRARRRCNADVCVDKSGKTLRRFGHAVFRKARTAGGAVRLRSSDSAEFYP